MGLSGRTVNIYFFFLLNHFSIYIKIFQWVVYMNLCSPAVEEVYLAPEYICHFFLDSLSTDSSDFKSAG